MATDLLQQLAEIEVPAMPDDFDRNVHQRLNARLLGAHVAEVSLRALPFAFLHFVPALATGAKGLAFALTGRPAPSALRGENQERGRSQPESPDTVRDDEHDSTSDSPQTD
jgi:hypothetical protein